ncbi:hypothetical protein C8A01DRAFT_42247 [Parachaetomium inaequale]|uniref:Uncharacterized protein n=1 Tax=Parachaetomium inaequale TaxID=2588326 RepID=A0AAN6P7Q7_9PEZI|nr:hypothetical protein C8A01DRAFT_42247 [Parachaetomium inaequale]
MYRAAVEGHVERLDPSTCLNAYASNFQSDRGDLLLVTPGFTLPPTKQNNLGLRTETLFGPTSQPYCSKQTPDSWTPFNVTVKECYSLLTTERCKLLFIPRLCWLVTALNLLKALLMLAAALRPDARPLLTLGDAVASFTAVPDKCTENLCLVSKQDIPSFFARDSSPTAGFGSKGRRDLPTLMALGLGTPSSKTIIQASNQSWGWGSVLCNIIMANSPQAVLSILYFIYNGLFTTLSLATERDSYARNRKGLRVSLSPVGAQRASYYLQLAYRYSLTLLAFSIVLHWLISQSIFLVFIEMYRNPIGADLESNYNPGSYNACGWSPAGVICVMVVGVVMVGFLLLFGCRRLVSSTIMPVVGSCSAAISAACHPVLHDERACSEPLQWGVRNYDGEENGHCSFSSGEVGVPHKGVMYS